ncbi:uncharacterized protein LOC144452097 [Glandiceps talaboti]
MAMWRTSCLRWLLLCGLTLTESTGRHLSPNTAYETENTSGTGLAASMLSTSMSSEQVSNTEKDSSSNDGCCEKQRKIISAGYDVSGRQIELDVGHCRKVCGSHTHRHLLKQEIPPDLNVTPEILRNIQKSDQSCPGRSVCEPTRLIRERIHLVGAPSEFDVIENCQCKFKPSQCRRQSRLLVLYPASPYQRTIDVGTCMGPCHNGEETCQSTKNKTITVAGPNGKECVSVIEDCGCRGECYRVSHIESYYEITYDNTLNRTVEKVKEIDIGQCVGTCSSGTHLRCVMRSPSNPDICLMSLVKKNVSCSPKTYTTYEFLSRGGAVKTALSVDECTCK